MADDFNVEVDQSLQDRLSYGEFLGDVKSLMMDMVAVPMWMAFTVSEHEDFSKIPQDEMRESFIEGSDFLRERLHAMLNLIQKHAVYLYGEEFPPSAFHVSDCDCDMHDRTDE